MDSFNWLGLVPGCTSITRKAIKNTQLEPSFPYFTVANSPLPEVIIYYRLQRTALLCFLVNMLTTPYGISAEEWECTSQYMLLVLKQQAPFPPQHQYDNELHAAQTSKLCP